MNMTPPKYLVQSQDGSLHGYHREDILRCDLASNKDNPPSQIFLLSASALTIRYDPINLAEIVNIGRTKPQLLAA